jgi:hypothetical protein
VKVRIFCETIGVENCDPVKASNAQQPYAKDHAREQRSLPAQCSYGHAVDGSNSGD